MKKLIFAGLALAALSMTGCATIVRGTSQNLRITSTPSGARARLSTGPTCITPCTMKLKRNQSLVITYTKPGCHPAQVSVYPTIAGSGVILGGLIDYGDGAVYNLVPNPANALLLCRGRHRGARRVTKS